MCATNRPHACFRQAEVLHLALLDQIFHRTSHVFNRHLRINAVLIEQIDYVGSKALQRSIGHLLDVLRPAVQSRAFSVIIYFEAKLRCDDDLVTKRLESFADKFFICVGAIDGRRIEEGYAAFARCSNERDCLLLFSSRAKTETLAHVPEVKG